MKNWKSLPLLLMTLIAVACFTMSCGEDLAVEEENVAYVVDVEIINPANNAQMIVDENFNVEVGFVRAENIIHNIKVEILDEDGHQVMNLVERHAHVANEFTFTAENIAISAPGTYTLRAATTDLHLDGEVDSDGHSHSHGSSDGDEQEKNNIVEHTFTVQ